MSPDRKLRKGSFQPGNPGKPFGAVNKLTKDLKAMILGALDKAGGEEYLQRQADTNPGAFLTLIGKVLPTTLSNDPENPVSVTVSFVGMPHV